MLGPQHEFIGGIIGLLLAIWLIVINQPIIAIGCILIAMWAANLPDLLDPATSPFHRSIGHNFISLGMFIIISIISFSLSIIFQWWFFILVSAFSLSYLSHLIMDLATPMGLPLFAGKSILGIVEIPLYLIPIVNIAMIIVNIVLAVYTIKFLAKKVGGILAMIILFIPIWGSFLLLGIALWNSAWFSWLAQVSIFLFIITIIILFIVGHKIDIKIKKDKKKTKK